MEIGPADCRVKDSRKLHPDTNTADIVRKYFRSFFDRLSPRGFHSLAPAIDPGEPRRDLSPETEQDATLRYLAKLFRPGTYLREPGHRPRSFSSRCRANPVRSVSTPSVAPERGPARQLLYFQRYGTTFRMQLKRSKIEQRERAREEREYSNTIYIFNSASRNIRLILFRSTLNVDFASSLD